MTENTVGRWSRELAQLLVDRSWRIAVAESCTGGLLGSSITDLPGSSDYFAGGVIAYSNHVKIDLLGVSERLIAVHGAVSEAVALEMAAGCRALLGTEVGVATTGVAGPSGTESKPVGLVYVAVATEAGVVVRRFCWSGNRIENKRATVEAALQLTAAIIAGKEDVT